MLNTWIAAGAAVGMFAVLMPVYLILKQGKNIAAALTFKGLCTCVAVLLSAAGAWRSGTADAWWITAGLFVCMLADIAIGISLVSGVLAFLLGHLCYITAFRMLAPFSLWSMVVFVAAAGLFVLFFVKRLDKMGNAKIPLCFYVAVISSMLALAVMLPLTLGIRGWMTAAGAVLFVLSDMLLGRNMFIRCTRLSDAFCLTCYYAGQYLIALSVFLPL